MQLATGTRLGPYEILAKVGEGGMGEVFRARDERLGRDVAIKVLPDAVRADPDRLRRFAEEARAAGALNHPNLLAVYDFDAAGPQPYLVSELLDGTPLRAQLDAGPVPLRRVRDWALQIARGLGAVHERGIVHRDLKPENLFVTRDGRVKILDFGLAKALPAGDGNSDAPGATLGHTADGAVLGTAGYMSPEQVQGRAADARSDVFSLGAILYELLAGERAFPGTTPVEKAYAILKHDPPPPSTRRPEVPVALERLVLRCLEKAPEARFHSARDLAWALEALDGGASGVASQPRLDSRPRPPSPSLRRIAFGVAALVACALAFAIGRRSARIVVNATTVEKPRPTQPAHYERLTFHREGIGGARFTPDGKQVVYNSSVDGDPARLYVATPGTPEARPISAPATVLFAISPTGEMALGVGHRDRDDRLHGLTLARAPLAGGTPREVLDGVLDAAWSADGSELAVVHRVGGKVRLEYPIGHVLVETDGAFGSPRVSPHGDVVAFADYPLRDDDRGSIALVTRDGHRRTLSSGWLTIEGLAWSPDGSEVWFAAGNRGATRALHAVSLEGKDRLVAEAPGGLTLSDIASDGRVLLTRASTRQSLQLLGKSATPERDLAWLDCSTLVDLTPDGKRVVFVEGGDAASDEMLVYVRDTDGTPAVRVGSGRPWGLSPDGQLVLLSPRAPWSRLSLVPTGAGSARDLEPGTLVAIAGAGFFPDGKRIAIEGREEGRGARLWLQDLDGGAPRAITPEGWHLGGTHASPDGKQLLARDDAGRFALVPEGGGDPHLLPELGGATPIEWHDAGRALVLARRADGGGVRLSLLRLDNGREQPWRELRPAEVTGFTRITHTLVTPDGGTIVYQLLQMLSDLYQVTGLS